MSAPNAPACCTICDTADYSRVRQTDADAFACRVPSRVTEGKYCLCCGRAEAGAPAPAPYARQRYHHVAPDGQRCAYSDADHALIACVPSQDVLLVIS